MERTSDSEVTSANGASGTQNPRARQRALCVGVLSASPGDVDPLAELKELLRTAGVANVGEVVQVRSRPDPDRYLGRGKLSEVKAEIAGSNANLVVCDDELVPRQERNLEQQLGVPVIDRTAVILDIFADHAHSAEGKLQVELAQLEYNLARMRGLWTHLERLGGGIGTRARASPRSRPTAAWHETGSRTCGAASSAWSETARSCGPVAAAPRCRSSRSPATRTRASQRSSMR